MSKNTDPQAPADRPEEASPAADTEDFAALLAAYDSKGSLKLRPGDRVRAEVIHVTNDTVFCQLSPTQEAFLAKDELVDTDGKVAVAVGDTVEAFIHSLQDGIELRRKIGGDQIDLLTLETARESKLPVEGKVTGTNKGGLEVSVAGTRGFCPLSQADLEFVETPSDLVGQTLEFLVTQIKNRGREVVLSRRALLETRRQEQAQELLSDLAVGQRRSATVSRITSFGAFADLGGVDGLIPISEVAHHNVERVEDVLSTGQEVEVEVLRIEDDPNRPGRPRIAMSLKATLPDPFVVHADALHEGAQLEGPVVRIEKFGAFIELFPGIQGLAHVSELADRHVRHPKDVVQVGEMVTVRVLSFDPSRQRISLSLREARPVETPGAAGELRVGQDTDGVVERIERYGLFVKLTDGGRALLPTAETSSPPNTDLAKAYPVGTQVPVRIIAIDDRGRIRVSQKAREADDERQLVDAFNRSQGGGASLGTLGDLLKAKLGQ